MNFVPPLILFIQVLIDGLICFSFVISIERSHWCIALGWFITCLGLFWQYLSSAFKNPGITEEGPDASFCKVCKHYVTHLDHHCVLTGSCIGTKNYWNFLLLLLIYHLHTAYSWVAFYFSTKCAEIGPAFVATGFLLLLYSAVFSAIVWDVCLEQIACINAGINVRRHRWLVAHHQSLPRGSFWQNLSRKLRPL